MFTLGLNVDPDLSWPMFCCFCWSGLMAGSREGSRSKLLSHRWLGSSSTGTPIRRTLKEKSGQSLVPVPVLKLYIVLAVAIAAGTGGSCRSGITLLGTGCYMQDGWMEYALDAFFPSACIPCFVIPEMPVSGTAVSRAQGGADTQE
ncbi:hypothetical protein J3458_014520 [Metarhizium acridum]|uniref:uncharacterized protein n=1 Tax=Metarhizium acridum TaxID=92637 RepID=UPI001C6AB262|nr:hypothetical protein J3458_014520 [Metarhizium acridum]